MSKIILLDELTINKIAAGEVIEKPASIVKELVENSIDAGAAAITIEIMDGGKSYISVSDNGHGIAEEDVPNVFERHATSKIKDSEDLFDIHTLGFRGEAMASISAVAEVELQTKSEDSPMGSYMLVKGGKIIEQKPIGYPTGTSIIVRNLFYNTPARLKFLKSDTTEQGYIVDAVEKLALTNTGISFKLIVNGKVSLHTPGNGDLLSVILCIYGKKTAKAMIPLKYGSEFVTIEGYIGKPEIAKGNTTFMIFSVNNRIIKSRVMTEAVKQAYKTLLMNNRFPFSILNIHIPPDKIDVNVHPTKLEVKFTDERAMFNTLYIAVKNCLNTSDLFYSAEEVSPEAEIAQTPSETPGEAAEKPPAVFEEHRRDYNAEGSRDTLFGMRDTISKKSDFNMETTPARYEQETMRIGNQSTSALLNKNTKAAMQNMNIQTDTEKLPPLLVLGQLFGTYILGQDKENFYLIDQHAAHERVMYEFLMEKYKSGDITVQPLLLPIILDLSPVEVSLLNANMTIFQRLGFEIEWFGENTIAIRAIPIIMGEPCSGSFFSTILDTLGEITKQAQSPLEKIVVNMACKNAVKANTPLSPEEVEALLTKLSKADLPYTCPHGRPTMVTLSRYEIEKKFKRIL